MCQPCHEYCTRCTAGDTRSCEECRLAAIIDGNGNIFECVLNCDSIANGLMCRPVCTFGTYLMGSECEPCNAECNGCTGGTNTDCIQCQNYMNGEECVSTCPDGTYVDSTTSQCLPCHTNCRVCFGPLETNCTTCRYTEVKTSNGSIVCGDDCFIGWEYTIEDRKCVP